MRVFPWISVIALAALTSVADAGELKDILKIDQAKESSFATREFKSKGIELKMFNPGGRSLEFQTNRDLQRAFPHLNKNFNGFNKNSPLQNSTNPFFDSTSSFNNKRTGLTSSSQWNGKTANLSGTARESNRTYEVGESNVFVGSERPMYKGPELKIIKDEMDIINEALSETDDPKKRELSIADIKKILNENK